jgi:hypothetical protein
MDRSNFSTAPYKKRPHLTQIGITAASLLLRTRRDLISHRQASQQLLYCSVQEETSSHTDRYHSSFSTAPYKKRPHLTQIGITTASLLIRTRRDLISHRQVSQQLLYCSVQEETSSHTDRYHSSFSTAPYKKRPRLTQTGITTASHDIYTEKQRHSFGAFKQLPWAFVAITIILFSHISTSVIGIPAVAF